MNKNNKRKKAWIGAVIGAVTSIAGSAISSALQKKQAMKQQIAAKAEQARQQAYNQAAAMTEAYNNRDYIDNYYKKVSLKRCGGKMKKPIGGKIDFTKDILPSMIQGVSTIATNTIHPNLPVNIVSRNDRFKFTNKKDIEPSGYNIINDNNIVYTDRLQQFKLGGRNRKKC